MRISRLASACVIVCVCIFACSSCVFLCIDSFMRQCSCASLRELRRPWFLAILTYKPIKRALACLQARGYSRFLSLSWRLKDPSTIVFCVQKGNTAYTSGGPQHTVGAPHQSRYRSLLRDSFRSTAGSCNDTRLLSRATTLFRPTSSAPRRPASAASLSPLSRRPLTASEQQLSRPARRRRRLQVRRLIGDSLVVGRARFQVRRTRLAATTSAGRRAYRAAPRTAPRVPRPAHAASLLRS